MTPFLDGILAGLFAGLAIGVLVSSLRTRARLRETLGRLETLCGHLQPMVSSEQVWRHSVDDHLDTIRRDVRNTALYIRRPEKKAKA